MPARDLTRDRLAMRQHARQSACSHGQAVAVDLSTGERVAWLCPDCDAQLAPGHWISLAGHDLLPATEDILSALEAITDEDVEAAQASMRDAGAVQ